MAVAALEAERLTRSIFFLALSSIGIGSIFLSVGANYAAALEFILYAGILIILFIVAASLTETDKLETNEEKIPSKEVKL